MRPRARPRVRAGCGWVGRKNSKGAQGVGKRQMLRIGCGSAYAGDGLDWSVDLAKSGVVSYLSFDCLAEATMTFAQLRRVLDPAAGYADNLTPVVRDFGGFVADGLKIVGNFRGRERQAAPVNPGGELRQTGVGDVPLGAVEGGGT